jgi:hypothetical protein
MAAGLVMIPPFNDNGYLPPGVHEASLDEIAERFGRQSEIRVAQMDSVRWLVDLALRAGVERIVLNGSFVTSILEPNDVDCALLIGSDFPKTSTAKRELKAGLPFLEIEVVNRVDFDRLVDRFFATDRRHNAKGMIEVML